VRTSPVFRGRAIRSLGFWLLLGASLVGCKHRRGDTSHGEFFPPRGAKAFEARYSSAFDDSFTPTVVNLVGRAPNDVLDQRLFQARLGYADVVALVRVEQVFGRGRYQGRQDQFVEVSIGEVLMGELTRETNERQLLLIDTHDDLPGRLKGEIMVLFLRWAPGSNPPYHHHMAPAQPESVALIKAMVKHAKSEGVINKRGREKSGKRAKRERRERKAERKSAKAGKKK
jgi:hypothetical protein